MPPKIQTAPLSLYASAVLEANASGGVNKDALINPTGFPIMIQSIKWEIVPASGTVSGVAVGCRLDYGDLALTNGFVPISMFCRDGINAADGVGFSYEFKPSKGIYVPPRGLISPAFQHFGLTKQSITVKISYSCKVLLDKNYRPNKLIAPYIASYSSKVFDAFSATTEQFDASTETDLRNPFNEPLNVERFVGRINLSAVNSESVNEEIAFADSGSRLIQIRMTDSFGEPVIADYAAFGLAFPGQTKSWEVPHQLGRQGYYLAFIKRGLVDGTDQLTGYFSSQAFVSMVGSHEVKL